MLEHFLKIQENIRISILKRRLRNLYKKENFKLEIEAMTENLQFYQLDNKQARSAKLRANIRWELQGKKCSKTFFKVLQKQNLQNQTIFELYILMMQIKNSSSRQDILKSAIKVL